MRRQASFLKGYVRVGTIPILGRLGLVPCIAQFHRIYPGIHVEIKEGKTLELMDRLHSSDMDVAFVVPSKEIHEKTIVFHPVIEDELVLVVDELHPLAKKSLINLSDAAHEKFIFADSSSSMNRMAMDACLDAGFTPNVIYECGQADMILGLVGERLGVTIMARKVAAASAIPHTICLPLKTRIQRITALAVPNQFPLSQPVKLFVRHVLQGGMG
ncbi:LysR family transcriptional regulator substrate-binding protein [Ammoniphilus sp. 3BR4]|uniref:LysR family transcriptional regulator substrate-binding protein n=1 Tax=Ammoniphilus sp. 3BR4 TaxID=3158265 RepID=UPI00346677F0